MMKIDKTKIGYRVFCQRYDVTQLHEQSAPYMAILETTPIALEAGWDYFYTDTDARPDNG